MNDGLRKLVEEYESALLEYLSGGEEPALQRAYELGRRVIAEKLGVLDLAAIHREVLAKLLPRAHTVEESASIGKAVSAIFAESLSPFEMTHRGFREANAELRRLADTLEERVADRTKALRESEERYRSLAQSATDAVIGCRRGRTISFWNTAAETIFGYSAEEIVGKPVDFVIPERLRQAHKEKVERLLSLGIPEISRRVFETVGLRKDGSEFPVELSYGSWTARGEPFFVAIVRDITERKKAEEEIRRTTTYLESILNSSLDLIFTVRRDATFGYFNPKLDKITGYTPDQIRGKHFIDFIPEHRKEFMLGKWLELNEKRAPQVYESEIIKADGTIAHVLVSTSVLEGFDEFLTVLRDITDHKRAEKALKERDLAIRKAYVDVIFAVTGGRFIIMTPEEVEDSLGEPISGLCTISSYEELMGSRTLLKDAIKKEFADIEGLDLLVVAVGEALTNAIKHAGGGRCRAYRRDNTLQIAISDTGPGIDFSVLPKATLLTGYSTAATLGLGFSIMLEICDRVLLTTQPGNTTVVLEKIAKPGSS